MNTTRGLIVVLFVLVVGAMGIAACGGDDDDAKTSATATSQGSQATTAATTPAGDEPASAATTAAVNPTAAPGNGGSSGGTACDLLTKEEVEQELGETVNAPDVGETFEDMPLTGGGTGDVSTCGWTSESFASSISLTFWSAPGQEDGIRSMIDLACTQHEEISGLGDRACWYDQQHAQIQASKGGYFIDIFATMSSDPSSVLETLTEKAIERLP